MNGLLALLPSAALAMTIVNLVTWRRARPNEKLESTVSILVPARNEAERIDACLAAARAAAGPIVEILVYDDESTDGTRALVEANARADARVRLVPTVPLSPGWIGKPHACQQLATQARGDILVFVDADVRLERDGVQRLAALLDQGGAALATAVPRQVVGTAGEALMIPLLLLTYASWLPLALVGATRDPRIVAANGQLVVARRDELARLGFFRAVAHEIVDDVALVRAAKRAGLRVAFADGTRIARCRMYRSGADLWKGFEKNIAEGLGGALGVLVASLLYVAAFLAPWVIAPIALLSGGPSSVVWAAAAGVLANVVQRVVLAARYRQPWWSIVLHPVAIAALVVLSFESLRALLSGRITWAGRVYGKPSDRKAAA